jgi:hypothetical protein
MVVEVGSLNLEDLVALRDKVKARDPQRFAKTLWEVAWQGNTSQTAECRIFAKCDSR